MLWTARAIEMLAVFDAFFAILIGRLKFLNLSGFQDSAYVSTKSLINAHKKK